jgi:hypothetical protein
LLIGLARCVWRFVAELIAANIGLLAGIAPAIVAARAEIVPALRAT